MILNILSKGLVVFLNVLNMFCCPGSRSACANTSVENSWGGGQPPMHSWVPVGHADDTADELITRQFACCFSKSRCLCTFNPFLASYSPSLVSASVFFLEEFFQLSLMSGIIVSISHLHIPSGQLSCHPHSAPQNYPQWQTQHFNHSSQNQTTTSSEVGAQLIIPGKKHILFKILPLIF